MPCSPRQESGSGSVPDTYFRNGMLLTRARSSEGLVAARRTKSAVANVYARTDGVAEEMEHGGAIIASNAVCNAVLHAWGTQRGSWDVWKTPRMASPG